MKQQAEGSWNFRPAFLNAQENVSGHHDSSVGDEGIRVPQQEYQALKHEKVRSHDLTTLWQLVERDLNNQNS